MKSLERREIRSATAQDLIENALDYARQRHWEVAAAVVDPNGYLVAFGRTDDVAPPIGEFAIDKAYTAGTLRKSTKAFGDRMASTETLGLGLSTRNRFLAWGGGAAILEDGTCIGGLGVSGAREHEDIDCAEHAIRACGLQSG